MGGGTFAVRCGKRKEMGEREGGGGVVVEGDGDKRELHSVPRRRASELMWVLSPIWNDRPQPRSLNT